MWDRLKTGADENRKRAEEQGIEPTSAEAGVPATVHRQLACDDKRQVEQLLPYTRPHEILMAVFNLKGGGAAFLEITKKRLTVRQGFLREEYGDGDHPI